MGGFLHRCTPSFMERPPWLTRPFLWMEQSYQQAHASTGLPRGQRNPETQALALHLFRERLRQEKQNYEDERAKIPTFWQRLKNAS